MMHLFYLGFVVGAVGIDQCYIGSNTYTIPGILFYLFSA